MKDAAKKAKVDKVMNGCAQVPKGSEKCMIGISTIMCLNDGFEKEGLDPVTMFM